MWFIYWSAFFNSKKGVEDSSAALGLDPVGKSLCCKIAYFAGQLFRFQVEIFWKTQSISYFGRNEEGLSLRIEKVVIR